MTTRPTFRFAPSPNGELHLGHAYSALLNFDLAQRHGGRFLLRVEDVDLTRSRPEHVAGIFDQLAWLGIAWEEPVRRQSEHFADYLAAAAKLLADGLLYPCFATRADIEAATRGIEAKDPDGAPLYPGIWRGADPASIVARQSAGEPFAMRLDMGRALAHWRRRGGLRPPAINELADKGRPHAALTQLAAGQNHADLSYFRFDPDNLPASQPVACQPERWGDAVIVRKETPTSYHLSVVVDDALQGVTHVVRGMDLEAATDIHRLLQDLLDLPQPAYFHHALITGPDGEKLAKRLASTSLRQMRAEGATPADIRRLAGLP
jgi:glutamyl-Q tRNA(Asp) synthetase